MPFSEFKESDFPDLSKLFQTFDGAAVAGVSNQNHYFKALTLLPFHINLSVAPARALTTTQAIFEGHEAAAIHAAVRKGDLLIGDGAGGLGVKVGSKNRTALAVVRGVFKSILVDALLRCDGASLSFSGVGVRNHISTMPQVLTYLGAHYLDSLRSNVPALLGSLAAFGNPIGLIRGLGDGVSDFVSEPVKGLKRSVKELDPSFVVDGVARGTESLARHTLGGFADSASLLTETFSKNMAVLTLDRNYAQRRDRRAALRVAEGGTATFVEGVESGVVKLIRGIVEGVTGVVRAPIRGAEKRGVEGFAKGVGKGLLGLLVKPVIGLSDAATDVMIGVKGSVEGGYQSGIQRSQVRPRRALYGRDRSIRAYQFEDATAASLFMSTRLAGENYLSHLDMEDKVALLSVKRLLLLGEDGEERLIVRYRQIKELEVRDVLQENGDMEYGVIVFLNSPRTNGSEVEVIGCKEKKVALELCEQVKRGINLVASDV
uniref:Vacuolar protein sorting-associated protein 13 DH-like domain-containing protein n=1 Tax=Attheya septentrionalis TaxID=420275 RepID=A0A7S2U5Y0_9STRA